MMIFEDIQDLEEWLDPLDYLGFWHEIAVYDLFTEADRAHCDGLIAGGEVRQDAVLAVLKTMARLELAKRFALGDRIYVPVDAPYLASVH